jgi:hypothetical protein
MGNHWRADGIVFVFGAKEHEYGSEEFPTPSRIVVGHVRQNGGLYKRAITRSTWHEVGLARFRLLELHDVRSSEINAIATLQDRASCSAQ